MSKNKYINFAICGVAFSLASGFLYEAYKENKRFEAETVDLCERITKAKAEIPEALEEITKKYNLKGDFKYWVDYEEVEAEMPARGLLNMQLNCGSETRSLKQSR